MARFVNAGGEVSGIPGVKQDSITRASPSVPSVISSGVMAILGECTGGMQPTTIYEYTPSTAKNLKNDMNTGELYDGCRFAFDPSYNDPQEVKGASKVLAISINSATQSVKTILGAAASILDFTSIPYGLAANGVNIKELVDGSSGGLGKKLTIGRSGKTDEVKDDIGFNPIFSIAYAGAGSAAAMTVTRTSLATTITGAAPDDISAAFSSFDTITKLVDHINSAHPAKYSIVITVPNPDTYLCENLDFVTAVDIKPETGTLSTATAGSTVYTVGSFTGEDTGDVISVGGEYMFIENAGTKTITRGYMDSVPAIHTTAAATTLIPVGGTNQAIIDWVNTYSNFTTAARNSTYPAGVPVNITAATYFTGGTEGTTAAADWQNAIDLLRDQKVNFVCVTTSDSAVHTQVSTFLKAAWGSLGIETLAHVGAAADETLSQLKIRSKALQDSNIALWFAEIQRDNDQGVLTWYDPWAQAIIKAATQAGMDFGEALTYKTTKCADQRINTAIDLIDDGNTLVEYGISFDRYYDGAWRTVRCLSTWTNNDDDEKIEMTLRHPLGHTVYKVRDRLKFFHLGRKALSGNALSIKSTVARTLDDIRDNDKAIVAGSEYVNGTKVFIPAYKDIAVSQNGNVAVVTYQCTPIGATDFIPVSTIVGTFQDVA